jgi:hypothetical protein
MGCNLNLRCKAVLFDMDGTLVDSTVVVELAWGWWAARHGLPLEAVLSFAHGRPTIATMEHFLPARDHTQELEEMERYALHVHLIGSKPDLTEAMRSTSVLASRERATRSRKAQFRRLSGRPARCDVESESRSPFIAAEDRPHGSSESALRLDPVGKACGFPNLGFPTYVRALAYA